MWDAVGLVDGFDCEFEGRKVGDFDAGEESVRRKFQGSAQYVPSPQKSGWSVLLALGGSGCTHSASN